MNQVAVLQFLLTYHTLLCCYAMSCNMGMPLLLWSYSSWERSLGMKPRALIWECNIVQPSYTWNGFQQAFAFFHLPQPRLHITESNQNNASEQWQLSPNPPQQEISAFLRSTRIEMRSTTQRYVALTSITMTTDHTYYYNLVQLHFWSKKQWVQDLPSNNRHSWDQIPVNPMYSAFSKPQIAFPPKSGDVVNQNTLTVMSRREKKYIFVWAGRWLRWSPYGTCFPTQTVTAPATWNSVRKANRMPLISCSIKCAMPPLWKGSALTHSRVCCAQPTLFAWKSAPSKRSSAVKVLVPDYHCDYHRVQWMEQASEMGTPEREQTDVPKNIVLVQGLEHSLACL